MTTLPLPQVPGEAPPPERAADGPTGSPSTTAPRWLRALESVAGLLSAGVAVAAVVLVLAAVLAPRLGGTGLEASVGPGLPAVLWSVGLAGSAEVLRAVRRTMPIALRAVVAGATLVAVIVWLWFVWWR